MKRLSWIKDYTWLIVGCVLLLFVGGKWNVPVATWLAPVFLLRFFWTRERWYEILIALPAVFLSELVWMVGLMPPPPEISIPLFLGICGFVAVTVVLPYIVDYLMVRVLDQPMVAIFLFPALVTIVHFAGIYLPLGAGTAWVHGLFESKSLIQLVSITGAWGVSFLVAWFASLVNVLWEYYWDIARFQEYVLAFVVVLSLVLVYGGFRLSVLKPRAETVKVGSVLVEWPGEMNYFWGYILRGSPEEEAEEYRQETHRIHDELFAISEKLIPSGVKIMVWPVGNSPVFEDEEEELIRRAQFLAEDNGIYLFMPVLTIKVGQMEAENKTVAIQPDGTVAFVYHKMQASLVEPLAESSESMPVLDTPYGRLSTAICWDMGFPQLIRQAGRNRVDILLVPADQPAKLLTPTQTHLYLFRGIESGASVVLPTLDGLSAAIDYQGRVLAQQNFYTTLQDRTIIYDVPTRGVRTLYALAGDWFAYLVVAATVVLVGWAVWKKVA
jgi:apolipoprotein N-acyltransferase